MRIFRCFLLAAWLLGAAATESAAHIKSTFTYNSYMASLSTAPQPFNGMYGHWHALTADDMVAMEQAGGQMLLVTLKLCAAFAPHYHTNCAETFYVKAGVLEAVMVVEGEVLQRSLHRGDMMTVPKGVLHMFSNKGCDEAEALIVLSSSGPDTIYPADQLLGLPQQAQISSFGLTNFSEFQASINSPKGHLYSLNDALCKALCNATTANSTGSGPHGRPRLPPDADIDAATAPLNQPAQASPDLGKAGGSRGSSSGSGSGSGSGSRIGGKVTSAGTTVAGRSLLGAARRALGWHLAAAAGSSAGGAGVVAETRSGTTTAAGSRAAAGAAGAGVAAGTGGTGHTLAASKACVYNDYMASILRGPVTVDNDFADQRRLTHDELPGLGKSKTEVLWTRFRPCSTSVPRFQPNADEFTTVLSGTIDLILVVGGTCKVVRTMQPGDVAVIPKGVLSYFANANCQDSTALTVYNSKGANRVYPVSDLTALPEEVLTAVLGLEGGLVAYPGWEETLRVPSGSLNSLNDPQCTARCDDDGTVAPSGSGEDAEVLSGTAANTKQLKV